MTDLNDFFAKKDRKKKRAAAKSAQAAAAAQNDRAASEEVNASQKNDQRTNGATTQQPNPSDDGWIEIEDPRGSQVYTGGRTVTELKRDNEEKDVSGENTTQAERFSGWGVKPKATAEKDEEDADDNSEDKSSTAPAPVVNDAAYPSLADAAKVQSVTPAAPSSNASSGSGIIRPGSGATAPGSRYPGTSGRAPPPSSSYAARARPRLNLNTEALKRKLAERAAETTSPTREK